MWGVGVPSRASTATSSAGGMMQEGALTLGRSYLLRLNSDLGVLGLYGNPIESRIHSYTRGGYYMSD